MLLFYNSVVLSRSGLIYLSPDPLVRSLLDRLKSRTVSVESPMYPKQLVVQASCWKFVESLEFVCPNL